MNSPGSSNQRSDRESTTRRLPTDPQRVEAFANFFKKYMSVSTVVVAALPIPVTYLRFIPTYHFQTKLLSVYASLFCFLVLAFIFYNRQVLARWMFIYYFAGLPPYLLMQTASQFGSYLAETPKERAEREERERQQDLEEKRVERRWKRSRALRDFTISVIPLFLILLSLGSVFAYHTVLTDSVMLYQGEFSAQGSTFDEVLQHAEPTRVPQGSLLMLLYLSIFVTAEAAFVLMAIKEYLQDYLQLDDENLIRGRADVPPEALEVATAQAQPGEYPPDDGPEN
jgi:hypothetical protein